MNVYWRGTWIKKTFLGRVKIGTWISPVTARPNFPCLPRGYGRTITLEINSNETEIIKNTIWNIETRYEHRNSKQPHSSHRLASTRKEFVGVVRARPALEESSCSQFAPCCRTCSLQTTEKLFRREYVLFSKSMVRDFDSWLCLVKRIHSLAEGALFSWSARHLFYWH